MTQKTDQQLFEEEIFRRLKKAINSRKAVLRVFQMNSDLGVWGTISVKVNARLEVHGEIYNFDCTFHSSAASQFLSGKWSFT